MIISNLTYLKEIITHIEKEVALKLKKQILRRIKKNPELILKEIFDFDSKNAFVDDSFTTHFNFG